MAWTYDNALGEDVNDAIIAMLNGGTMEITTAGGTVLAVLALASPCATASNKVLTFNTITDDSSINADGTAALARFKDSGGNIRISGLSVGTSSTDVVVNSTAFVTGKVCSITSATITQP